MAQIRRLKTAAFTFLFLTFLFLTGYLVACQQPPQPVNEIRIGLIAPLSGEVSSVGESSERAAKLAVGAVNEAGGLDVAGQKYRLVLLMEDSAGVPDTAVAAARKLINQDEVIALIGPQISRDAIPVANVAEQARIPMISPYSTNPQTTAGKQFVFRVAYLDTFQGEVMARFALGRLGSRRAAVLYDVANDYNQDIANFFRQAFIDGGGQVIAFESYTTGEDDFSDQLTRIRDSAPQVLFLPNYSNEVPEQARQAREIGVNATILGSDSWELDVLSELPVLEGAFVSAHYSPDAVTATGRRFIADYQQQYDEPPNDVAALTFDAFNLLFRAIQTQGRADPEVIRAGLSRIRQFAGVTGTMTYDGMGDPAKSIVILQIRDGQAHYYRTFTP